MTIPRIAFIGAGNMAASMIGGLVEQGLDPQLISAADPFPESLERIANVARIKTFSDNAAAVAGAEIVILAVKPQVAVDALGSIAAALEGTRPLVISIAAGITIATMSTYLGDGPAIVRCMPNTPALLRAGATALYAAEGVSDEQRAQAEQVLGAVSTTCWVGREQDIDAVTALSGSGPAYFFLFMEAMADAGEKLGLDRDTATRLAMQTGLGASRMAVEGDVDLAELRRRVTSPEGTTERAVQVFEEGGLRELIEQAMQAAALRAAEMGRETG